MTANLLTLNSCKQNFSSLVKKQQLIKSHDASLNPLKRSGIKWLQFEVFSAIQV